MKIENIKLFDIFIPFIHATIKCVFRDINITVDIKLSLPPYEVPTPVFSQIWL